MSFISLYAQMVWPVKLIKTHVQHLLTATAMNMERLFSWYSIKEAQTWMVESLYQGKVFVVERFRKADTDEISYRISYYWSVRLGF